MNEETKEATLGSIEKWKRIEDGTGEDLGPNNCPLCQMFWKEPDCMGCPVADATEESCCDNSPYEFWQNHIYTAHEEELFTSGSSKVFCPKCKTLATAERKFLESLLETDHGSS